MFPVNVIRKLSRLPNNIKNFYDLYRAKTIQKTLTLKDYLQREDGSRLCLHVTLVEMLGSLKENTAL